MAARLWIASGVIAAACTADPVGAAVFVVAIQRSAVGDESFTLQLSERTVCGGDACGFPEKIVVRQP